jgi:S-adenosylmethionine uptake transporter
LLIIAAYRLAPAIVVAPMQYSQILWAAVLGAVVFGEAMTTRTIAGISIIIAAGLFILWRSSGANGRAG